MSPATSLSVAGLRKAFGDTPVLGGLDLEVPAGSLTAVLGPSGCGKTTLLRLLGGFERADAGSIRLGGEVLCDASTHLAPERRGRSASSPRRARSSPTSTSPPTSASACRARERRGGRVEELLALVDLDGLGRRLPHQLSGGQQQRVALARALAPEPGLVLLDEPFDALDAGLRAQVRGEVREALRAAGATALLVTHDQEEALSLADTVAVMRGGRIVQADRPADALPRPGRRRGRGLRRRGGAARGQARGRRGRDPARPAARRGGRQRQGETVTVMLRPEQILCRAGDGPGGRGGRVLSTAFYGHDATARIALEDGAARSSRGPPGTSCRRSASGSRSRSRAPRWPTRRRTARPPSRCRHSRLAARGRGHRRQRVAELGDPLREVDVQPVRDVGRRRLEDDLRYSPLSSGDDVVVGVGAARDAAFDLRPRLRLEPRQRPPALLAVAGVGAVAVEVQVVGVRDQHHEPRRAGGSALAHGVDQAWVASILLATTRIFEPSAPSPRRSGRPVQPASAAETAIKSRLVIVR